MRRLIILILMMTVTAVPALAAEIPEFPSPTGGGPTPLLFLHAWVNYRVDPVWLRAWERDLQSQHSLQVNVGSVTTDDFLTDVELQVTEPLNDRLRALYDMRWLGAKHRETPAQQHFLGFELGVWPSLGLQMQVYPTSRKQDVDFRTGVLWHTRARQQYVRLLVRWDDFLFGEKNDRGGHSDQVATSLEWTARLQGGLLELFSRGSYGSAARHSFPDSAASPVIQQESEQRGGSESRLRAVWQERRFAELELLHHRYQASLTPRTAAVGSDSSETYRNSIVDVSVRGVWGVNERWLIRAELHALMQEAVRRGLQHYDYVRHDWMPAVFVQWRWHPAHRLELGYLSAAYDWEGSPDATAEMEAGYVQKLELGWLVDFSDHARMQISLSHEPDPQRFGGGNVQFQLSF